MWANSPAIVPRAHREWICPRRRYYTCRSSFPGVRNLVFLSWTHFPWHSLYSNLKPWARGHHSEEASIHLGWCVLTWTGHSGKHRDTTEVTHLSTAELPFRSSTAGSRKWTFSSLEDNLSSINIPKWKINKLMIKNKETEWLLLVYLCCIIFGHRRFFNKGPSSFQEPGSIVR